MYLLLRYDQTLSVRLRLKLRSVTEQILKDGVTLTASSV